MTTHANPEPIQLIVSGPDPETGSLHDTVLITPDIARQIVAMAGIPRLDTDFIASTEQRIAALEADVTWLKTHAVVGGADGRDAEPSTPDADEAAKLIGAISIMELNRLVAPEVANQWRDAVAALRAKLTATEISGARAIERLRTDRDSLAAQVESLTRERDDADRRAGAAERDVAYHKDTERRREDWLRTAKQQWGVDDSLSFDHVWEECLKLKVELAAERAAHDATKDWGHVEEGKVEKLTADLAAMTERAEKAEADLRTLPHVCREWEKQRDAARAEADAIRASRDKLARLLLEVDDDEHCYEHCRAPLTPEERCDLMHRIGVVLAEVKP